MKHTPGPWKVFDAYEVYDDDGRPESINCLYVGTDSGERVIRPADYGHEINMTEANARLVAAAPDLLTACEKALAYTMDGYSSLKEQRDAEFRLAQLLAVVIARAKGE